MQRPVTVLGAGNVGCAVSGHLALKGFEVRLYSRWDADLEPIRRAGGIRLEGEASGFGSPSLLTTDIAQATSGASLILVTAPGFAHRYISQALAGVLKDGQVVVFQPGELGSALELLQCVSGARRVGVVAAETETSLYVCRLTAPATVFIGAIKRAVGVAAVPASTTDQIVRLLNEYFGPHYVQLSDTLAVGLGNSNPVYHCPPSIFNYAGIDQALDRALHELVTPGIANFMDGVDRERLALGAAFGIRLRSFWEYLESAYGVRDDDFVEAIRRAYGRQAFRAPTSSDHRYFTEDIPFGLVPWSSLAHQVGVDSPLVDGLITVAACLTGRDYRSEGRTAGSLGLEGMSASQIHQAFVTGPAEP